MMYIIIMYATKLSLAPVNRLLKVNFFGKGAPRGWRAGGGALRAMNRRNGEKARGKKN